MAYPAGHNEAVRSRILRAARRAFNLHGYEGVTIDQVMSAAGLTRGAFYFHFKSKAELHRQAIAFVLQEHPVLRWATDSPATSSARQLVDAYLSDRHLVEIEESCPLVTHAAEANRGDPEVQATFTWVLNALIDTIRSDLDEKVDSGKGLAIASMCVGGLSLARGVGNRELAARLLRETRSAAYEMAGWGHPSP